MRVMRNRCFTVRTREWGGLCTPVELLSEQWVGGMSKTDLADFFPQTVPKKYPRALGDIPPPHKSAHNDILCTDSNGNQAKQDKPGGGVPLAGVLLCVPRVAVSGVLHCPNTARI